MMLMFIEIMKVDIITEWLQGSIGLLISCSQIDNSVLFLNDAQQSFFPFEGIVQINISTLFLGDQLNNDLLGIL